MLNNQHLVGLTTLSPTTTTTISPPLLTMTMNTTNLLNNKMNDHHVKRPMNAFMVSQTKIDYFFFGSMFDLI